MSNRNLTNLAMLYDFYAGELDRILKSGIPYSDDRILKKLGMLNEASKTMSLVYQIENLRRVQSEEKVDLPEEKEVNDPTEVEAKKNNFKPQSGLSGHQGWAPF